MVLAAGRAAALALALAASLAATSAKGTYKGENGADETRVLGEIFRSTIISRWQQQE